MSDPIEGGLSRLIDRSKRGDFCLHTGALQRPFEVSPHALLCPRFKFSRKRKSSQGKPPSPINDRRHLERPQALAGKLAIQRWVAQGLDREVIMQRGDAGRHAADPITFEVSDQGLVVRGDRNQGQSRYLSALSPLQGVPQHPYYANVGGHRAALPVRTGRSRGAERRSNSFVSYTGLQDQQVTS